MKSDTRRGASMLQNAGLPGTSPKNRMTAAWLALLLGIFGVHQFYLGNKVSGIVRIVLTATIYGTLISLPLALIEFVKFSNASDDQFQDIYVVNKKAWPWQTPSSRDSKPSRHNDGPSDPSSRQRLGIESQKGRSKEAEQSDVTPDIDNYDLSVLDEPVILSAKASTGFGNGMIALTETRLAYLRKKGQETVIDRESHLNAVTDVALKKLLGTWQLSFNDGKAVVYNQSDEELEPFVEPLRAANDLQREADRAERWAGVVCSARGRNGQVHLFDDRVLITRQGFVSAIAYGFRGDKEVLISEITSIGWKEPGITAGYIHFEYVGGQAPVRTGVFADDSIANNENAVLFTQDHQRDFEEFRKLLEERRAELRKPQQVEVVAAATASPMEELKKLAELKEMGIVTEEEFEAKKKQLLGL